jgi:DNA-binding IclR family transcriptional regulator
MTHDTSNTQTDTELGVAAVNRALAMLDAFTQEKRALSLAELSEATGLYKSTLLRLYESLNRFGYMNRSESGMFTIGPRPMRLAAIYKTNLHPAEVVMPALRTLSERTRESAALYVRAGNARVCAYRVSSPRAVSDNVNEGDMLPLFSGASGKILLAFSGEKGADFDRIRETMICASLGERDPEVAAISCPVFAAGEELKGALALSGPIHRFNAQLIALMEPVLLESAREMTTAFGGDPAVYAHAGAKKPSHADAGRPPRKSKP